MGTALLFLIAALVASCVHGVAAAAVDNPNEAKRWIQVHGWLMYSSMGLLFPLGVILIRYSRPLRDPTATVSPTRAKALFYLHFIVMSVAVCTATAGVSILIAKLGTIWSYTHMRLGLALLIIMMMQPFIGLIRPRKGKTVRPYWFAIHWLFGTGALYLGIINIYIGIRIYELITQTSIRSLSIAFSIQIALMVLIYHLQGRWSYILRQSNAQKMTPGTKSNNSGTHQSLAI